MLGGSSEGGKTGWENPRRRGRTRDGEEQKKGTPKEADSEGGSSQRRNRRRSWKETQSARGSERREGTGSASVERPARGALGKNECPRTQERG